MVQLHSIEHSVVAETPVFWDEVQEEIDQLIQANLQAIDEIRRLYGQIVICEHRIEGREKRIKELRTKCQETL